MVPAGTDHGSSGAESHAEVAMTDFDLVIRNGTVVDGSGAPARTADVAVDGGVIREVGPVSGRGRREVDADGAVVAPGFVDIHTHYDGQASWDDRMQPSAWHGVTTAVMGNCGVGFAPARPGDRDRLIEVMEGVEDIPGTALHEGLTWDWESFPDYLDALGRRAYDIDLAAQVPHTALRVFVMRDRAVAGAQATPEEAGQMGRLAAGAVRAGAVGFSTSRLSAHKTVSGEHVPSYDAGAAELVAIARAVGETGAGVLQLVSDAAAGEHFALMADLVRASGRPLSFTTAPAARPATMYLDTLDRLTRANQAGLPIRGQVPARPVGVLLGLQHTLHPFMLNPVWQQVSRLPAAEQAIRMADPEFKAAVLAAQTLDVPPSLIGGRLIHRYDFMFELSDPPDYEPPLETSVAALAARTGRSAADIVYDIMSAHQGTGMAYVIMGGYPGGTLDAVGAMLGHDYTVPGLSDGGAHVGTISDGSFPTTLLAHWTRDRRGQRLPLPFVIQRQCRDTARAAGLFDRGELAPGQKADINVIDLERLRAHRPEMRFDLPGGGRRLVQRATGYQHTFVSGVETYASGEPTGELPGRLVRGRPFPVLAGWR
jgi:N-acyl-D-aspartate/D-glutamate deacylase